jgi:hypothetical protein
MRIENGAEYDLVALARAPLRREAYKDVCTRAENKRVKDKSRPASD